ncbi:MAG: hypothetical protein IT372_38840 [Polyangiaceae bacterium]|nr:hypothetical protein [Polyangiaceae bacterium]
MPIHRPAAWIALAAAAAALVGCPDETDPPPVEPPAWQVALDADDLDRAVLSVWGSGPGDVFVVGGPLGNTGRETLALRYDGERWRDLAPGGDETFWWVSGSAPDDVWMVGERGRIAHWDGASFTEHESGTTATLWGVLALSPADAWIVGGSPGGGASAPNDIVLHWDGAAWAPEPLPGEPLGRALYKVWGTSSDDLYVVGELGVIWHRAGATWERQDDPSLTTSTLFTVNGCGASEVYAVGGQAVLRSDGAAWTRLDVDLSSSVNGVACGGPGDVAIVGFGGLKQRLVDGAWINEFTVQPYQDLHAAWAEGGGAFWAVGGDFISSSSPGQPRAGVVARYGPGRVADAITP